MEIEETGKIIDKFGINFERHEELINCLSKLVEDYGVDSLNTSQLIDLIAEEPTLTKKERAYLGLYISATKNF